MKREYPDAPLVGVGAIIIEHDQVVLVRLLESLNGFWSSLVHRYAVYLSMSLRERLQLVLADLGARFGVQDARGVLLTPELAQEELAEMIGSSRPMVSKLLGEMGERSMIACQGRRYILLRGSGLDTAPRWLLPTAAKSVDEAAAGNGHRAGSLPLRSAGHDDHLSGRSLAARAERTAGAA